MAEVLRINTRTRNIYETSLKNNYRFFGNRGLVARFITDEVYPCCDPLGVENKLVLCTGIFAGTSVPACHRLSVGAKSPLTGGIKESNVGGNAAYQLAMHGIKMIVLEDKPTDDDWYIVKINENSSAELIKANQFIGLNTYALREKLSRKFGNNIAIIVIGKAGERQYSIASIMVSDQATGNPCRAAGRGGLGAVMGSKQIKAIIIEKKQHKQKFAYFNKERFDIANKKLINDLKERESVKFLRKVGTLGNVGIMGSLGIAPVKNFSGEAFEKLNQIDADALIRKQKENGGTNGLVCQPGCIVKCNNYYCDKDGNFITGGFEYETLALFGPNCNIANLDFIAGMDRFCDEMGMDSMEVASTIAVCMEAGKIPWGNETAVEKLLKELAKGTEFGDLMGCGTNAVGEYLGVNRIPTVKKQAISAYDPRNVKGLGATYSTSPMGADHTAGYTFVSGMNHMDKKGQTDLSADVQIKSATVDNMGCYFNLMPGFDSPDIFPDLMEGVYGGKWDMDRILEIGSRTLKMEIAFNKAAGLTEKDNKLPDFFYNEKSDVTGEVFDITSEEIGSVITRIMGEEGNNYNDNC
ncbi:MAG: aldehyde ferredoxin oxidoreductase C-terminal domain-containing protein [Syntrophomonas sp.]